ncbi:tn7-like transposition protein C [Brevibacillus laterosporus GI-9]|uniref:ATP-binding protein n=1 Tax=Brevibacillus laterosporus TaxID=1465 RepID=UPI00024054B8|nr:ATP-binding protein [Brevibacillus laterosporus]CCF16895.1 tn7-like transposition protein C [Brevibacillus laterosporus GI-9]
MPNHLRLHCVQRIAREFFQPLSTHIDLEQRISRLIRDGYVGRNPLEPNYAIRARNDAHELIKYGEGSVYPIINPSASGFAIVGISGIGKSSALARILLLYPQVVMHSRYKERNLSLYQIVWLKMDCPHDGSIKGLCLNFFHAIDTLLGTKYYKKHAGGRRSVDELLPIMAQIAAVHCLGVLIIDEIQNLSEAKSGGGLRMLNFFVQLVNTIGLPVVVVGTFKALPILDGEFRNARRGTGQGDLIWERMKNDDEWDFFLQGLWRFQWTKEKAEYTEEFKATMYYESQGITDIAIKLFMLSQWRAIDIDKEMITPAIIASVARDRLQLLQPALKALKTGNKNKIAKFGDVYSCLSIDDYYDELEAKFKQQQRLEIIKTELGFDPNDQVIKQISNWLIDSGIEKSVAISAAEKVIEENQQSLVDVDLNQMALKIALASVANAKSESAVPVKSSRKRKSDTRTADDLREVTALGQAKKISAYESLKMAGFIKNPIEFLA